jgi:hypothetical protein
MNRKRTCALCDDSTARAFALIDLFLVAMALLAAAFATLQA